jgi:hypothetical protein
MKRVQTTKVEITWNIQYYNIPIDIYDGDETLLLSMCAFYILWEPPQTKHITCHILNTTRQLVITIKDFYHQV